MFFVQAALTEALFRCGALEVSQASQHLALADTSSVRLAKRLTHAAVVRWQDLLKDLTNERGPWGVGQAAGAASARRWLLLRRPHMVHIRSQSSMRSQ
jgi:hypothetical protein